MPILEEVFRWDRARVQSFLESEGFLVREWDKLQTDTLILRRTDRVEAVPEGSHRQPPQAASRTATLAISDMKCPQPNG